MNRWTVRVIGILMLLVLLMLLGHLQKQLIEMQRRRPSSAPASTR